MNGGTTSFSGSGVRRTLAGLSSYFVGFSLVYLLWGFLTDTGTPAGLEYGFSLLAVFGAAGCLGHLLTYASRETGYLSSVFSVSGGAGSLGDRCPDGILIESADWPLLVALLFGPFFVLLAGLGGWV